MLVQDPSIEKSKEKEVEEDVAVTIPLTLGLLLSGQHQLSSAEPQHVHISEAGYFVQFRLHHSTQHSPSHSLLFDGNVNI